MGMNAKFNCCLIRTVITDIEKQLSLHILPYLKYVFDCCLIQKKFFFSDLSAVRHFIATDRKEISEASRKISAPAELPFLDREGYSKTSASGRNLARKSFHQVTPVLSQSDLCPR